MRFALQVVKEIKYKRFLEINARPHGYPLWLVTIQHIIFVNASHTIPLPQL
jgi:hypothetical protein